MPLAFVHAADLHLDSPLRGLSSYPDAPLERLRGASRQAFSKLIDTAIGRGARLMLLAGDVWDGDWPDVGTGLFFAREMGRLQRAGVRVVLLRGNHDAASRITRSIALPDNVFVLAEKKPESIAFDDLGVVVHGQSFETQEVTENLALTYPDAVAGRINIGLLHTALEGNANHATYAPCKLADLQAKGYDYWALGHVHEHEILAAGAAHEGGTIAFPGVLQGRHARETGAKGALWVEIDDAGARVERLVVDVVRWQVRDVDVAGVERIEDVAPRVREVLDDVVAGADAPLDERLLALRFRLVGRTALHGRLAAESAQVRDDAIGQIAAAAADGIFLEKIERATTPALEPEEIARRRDAVADLQQVLAEASASDELLADVRGHLVDFWNQLPAEVRLVLEADESRLVEAIRDERPGELLAAAGTALIDRLAHEDAGD